MALLRRLIGVLLTLAAIAMAPVAAASTSDSIYASPDLGASTGAPWSPSDPVRAARTWETVLRVPGRIVSLPLVGMGAVAERSLLWFEQSHALETALLVTKRTKELGFAASPASLGDHTGVGAEVRWAPHRLDQRLLVEANATTHQYNRERVTTFVGPLSAIFVSEWRPRELYFGPGLAAPISGESAYGEYAQSAKVILSWGWRRFDPAESQGSEPAMFLDRVRMRGPKHRTWVSAWAGPRKRAVTHGRDPDTPSFEILHPVEAAGSLHREVEHFTYGAGLSHDARFGLPHWSRGWRTSVEAERNDKSIRALALEDAHSGARSFTSMTYRAEGGASFGQDPRTFRLALTAVDQDLDAGSGTFLVADLQTLGGGAGLAGFESGRFRDVDLLLAKLSYIFPLVKNLEFEVHTESGGVYPDLREARLSTFESSFGAALRFRTSAAMFGALGYEWSSERNRFWFKLGGVE